MYKKIISIFLSLSLILTQPLFAQGAAELNIGKYLSQMPALNTDKFRLPHLRYLSYDSQANNFKLLLDKGGTKFDNQAANELNSSGANELNTATQELLNYFFIGLALPNEKFWVNLRPDAPEQIIDPELERTDIGKILLEADLQLKKDTASFTSPQTPEGKEYWDKLYKRAGELFGTENITIPTITRPWIVPGEVIIRETEDSAYVYKANLKVMLEEDYLKSSQLSQPQADAPTAQAVSSQQYNYKDERLKELNQYSTQLIRELILPKLTNEVNTAKRYASLRQVFFSLILSRWFKDRFGKSVNGSASEPANPYSKLIDSHNLTNLTSKESWTKTTYFNEYKKSFEQGEYNLKEQVPSIYGQSVRSYVSGGILPVPKARDINSYKATAASSISEKLIPIVIMVTAIGGATSGGILINELLKNVSVRVEILSSIDIAKVRSSAIRYILSESEIDTILFASNERIQEVFSETDFKSIEDFREWVNKQKGITIENRVKIEAKLSALEEEMRPMIRVYLDGILQELNSFKESSNSVKTDKISLTMFIQELLKDFNKRKASIKDYGELLGFIDGLLATLDTAYTEEEGSLEQFKTKVPYNFKELFDNTKQGLEGLKLQVYKEVTNLKGSSPLNDEEMAKKFFDDVIDTGIYKTHSAFSSIRTKTDIKNVLVSLFKKNIFTKYTQLRGTEVETARKIVEDYFLIEFNQANPKDSKISLKEAGISSAVFEKMENKNNDEIGKINTLIVDAQAFLPENMRSLDNSFAGQYEYFQKGETDLYYILESAEKTITQWIKDISETTTGKGELGDIRKKIIAAAQELLEYYRKEAESFIARESVQLKTGLENALRMNYVEFVNNKYTVKSVALSLKLVRDALYAIQRNKEAKVFDAARKNADDLEMFINNNLVSSAVVLDEEFKQITEYLWDSLADLEQSKDWRSLQKDKDWFDYQYKMGALLGNIANARKFHELFIVREVPTQIAALKVTLKYSNQKALADELDKIIKELYSKAKELKMRLEDDIKENKSDEGGLYQKQSAMGSLNLFLKNAPSAEPGSLPLTLYEARAEFKKIVEYHSDVFDLITDDMLENIFQSNALGVFSERMLIVTSMIAYELAYSKKSNEVFKSKIIGALIELMGKCKYGKQLSNDEEIIKEMKAVFVRKMERLNAISAKYLGDKTYPSWDAYAKEMKEVARRDVETPQKAELKKIVSSFEKKFSLSKYVAVFSQNLTIVGDLAVADISEYLELKILQYAITKASSSIEAALDSKNQEAGNVVGGIDFRKIEYLTQPMGSFQGLDLRLPLLSKSELEAIDIQEELADIGRLVNSKLDPSSDRIKRLLAAMHQKGMADEKTQGALFALLTDICRLKEEENLETSKDFRAVLLIADTGLYVEQGETRYSMN